MPLPPNSSPPLQQRRFFTCLTKPRCQENRDFSLQFPWSGVRHVTIMRKSITLLRSEHAHEISVERLNWLSYAYFKDEQHSCPNFAHWFDFFLKARETFQERNSSDAARARQPATTTPTPLARAVNRDVHRTWHSLRIHHDHTHMGECCQ